MRVPARDGVTRLPRRRVGAVSVAVVLVVVASSCSLISGFPDEVVIGSHSLTRDQSDAVIKRADAVFRRDAAAAHANIDSDARCFMHLLDGDAQRAADQVRCGPTRVFGGAKDDQWVSYLARPRGADVTIDALGGAFTPTRKPAGGRLVRPDNKTAVTDTDLGMPRPRPATAGFTSIVPTVGTASMRRPAAGRGYLAGPHTAIRISDSAVSPVVGTGATARRARAGEEFVIVRFAPEPAAGGGFPRVTFAGSGVETRPPDPRSPRLIVGGRPRPLPAVDSPVLAPGGLPTHPFALVVSVPRGQAVGLDATDIGRSQRLDLRTGARTGDPVFAPLYRRSNQVVLQRRLRTTVSYRALGGEVPNPMSGTITDGALVPYDIDRGFPPPGFAWLTVRLTDFVAPLSHIDWAPDAFTVTPTGGRPINGRLGDRRSDTQFLFRVPASFTTGTLTLRWTGTVDFFGAKPVTSTATHTIPIALPHP